VGFTLARGRTNRSARFYAAARSSLSAPRATISIASSGSGRCSALASAQGARIQTSRSPSVVGITGMALGWIGSTMAFGAVVRNQQSRWRPSTGLALAPQAAFHSVQMPENADRLGEVNERPRIAPGPATFQHIRPRAEIRRPAMLAWASDDEPHEANSGEPEDHHGPRGGLGDSADPRRRRGDVGRCPIGGPKLSTREHGACVRIRPEREQRIEIRSKRARPNNKKQAIVIDRNDRIDAEKIGASACPISRPLVSKR
jgi:hypothetical protein